MKGSLTNLSVQSCHGFARDVLLFKTSKHVHASLTSNSETDSVTRQTQQLLQSSITDFFRKCVFRDLQCNDTPGVQRGDQTMADLRITWSLKALRTNNEVI
ncbi:hypothetical protein DPMN_039987 [Dreissena polymorpha]|uniref:Uncharacterized protein n=1 Tax=Dreissena polymorpha TaxID=45954 RepID=A0A9D4CU79_DREPO|nr:hypothetical protein DPMN_039987 [Dreissena polymorpha]